MTHEERIVKKIEVASRIAASLAGVEARENNLTPAHMERIAYQSLDLADAIIEYATKEEAK